MNRLMTWWMLRNKKCTWCDAEIPAVIARTGRLFGYRRWEYGCEQHAHSVRYWSENWTNRKEYLNDI